MKKKQEKDYTPSGLRGPYQSGAFQWLSDGLARPTPGLGRAGGSGQGSHVCLSKYILRRF